MSVSIFSGSRQNQIIKMWKKNITQNMVFREAIQIENSVKYGNQEEGHKKNVSKF